MLMGMVSRPGSSRRGWGGWGQGTMEGVRPEQGRRGGHCPQRPPRGPYLVPLSEDSHPAPFQAPASGDK